VGGPLLISEVEANTQPPLREAAYYVDHSQQQSPLAVKSCLLVLCGRESVTSRVDIARKERKQELYMQLAQTAGQTTS
jgi:hypothetical protein